MAPLAMMPAADLLKLLPKRPVIMNPSKGNNGTNATDLIIFENLYLIFQ
jgi:hypothetical protein